MFVRDRQLLGFRWGVPGYMLYTTQRFLAADRV